MQTMIEYARAEGLDTIEGQVLNENTTMLRMCAELGFIITPDPNEPERQSGHAVIIRARYHRETVQCDSAVLSLIN